MNLAEFDADAAGGTDDPTAYRADEVATDALARWGQTSAGRRLRRELDRTYAYAPDQRLLFGTPLIPAPASAVAAATAARALVRCLQCLVEVSRTDPALSRFLGVPRPVVRTLGSAADPLSDTVHLARVDLLLPAGEPPQAIEGNANCPGGLLFAGQAAARWRERTDRPAPGQAAGPGIAHRPLPPPLPHEDPGWMADWFLALCERHTGQRPSVVALLSESGGNTLELPELAVVLERRQVRVLHADPRALTLRPDRAVQVDGTRVTHAYLKVGMRRLAAWWPELLPLTSAVAAGRLFVQNGLRARWIADSKLALAAITDRRIGQLLPSDLRSAVLPFLPWSRNVGALTADECALIAARRDDFVLKTPYGTRGDGVLVGRSTSPADWTRAVRTARVAGWLVQRYRPTATWPVESAGRHDLCLGVSADRVIGALARSGTGDRLNVAHGSRLHPVYLAGNTR